jgi:hypothetical protein
MLLAEFLCILNKSQQTAAYALPNFVLLVAAFVL